jgi:glutamate synthase domain-containing protein 2
LFSLSGRWYLWLQVSTLGWVSVAVAAALVALAAWDLLQRRHSILRTWPLLGHFRFLLELVGPELRQYIVTDNDSERPFSRDQRRWIYATSKQQDNRFGFGTDSDLDAVVNHLIIRPAAFPPAGFAPVAGDDVPVAKVVGAARGRRHAFRPNSIVNVSGMSWGALSGPAIEALNMGARDAGALQGTGEGGISPHHLKGGELVFQIGTGYFGCRRPEGGFDLERLVEVCATNPVRAVEIKLSQGAKPGTGGLLPAAKVTSQVAAVRGVPQGRDCESPPYHSEFRNEDEMLDFVELIAEATGLPVGIKSAVGDVGFWRRLAALMEPRDRGVDFIVIDGGEGGTGAGPRVWVDHVSMPFMLAFSEVIKVFGRAGLHHDVAFVGAGRLGLPERAIEAFALGCDWVNVGREAMLSVGCIQAMRCHTNKCPTGVATQSKWLMRGVDPVSKAERVSNYLIGLREEILAVARVTGAAHPAALSPESVTLLDGRARESSVAKAFGVEPLWAAPSQADLDALLEQWPVRYSEVA